MSEDLTQQLPPSPDGALAQILSAIQNIDTRLSSLEQRLGSLEQKVEDRLYDTRPIWEKVQADIAQLQIAQEQMQASQHSLQESQRSLQEGQEALRKDVREINTHWRDMNRKLSIFNDTLAEMQADYRDIYDRVRGLERQSS